MNENQSRAFAREVALARRLMQQGDFDRAFGHLERAHVLGQERVVPHALSHWLMLRIAIHRGEPFAVLGQAARIALGSLGSALGFVPTGNTGGTNLSMFARLDIDPELAAIMEGRPTDAAVPPC